MASPVFAQAFGVHRSGGFRIDIGKLAVVGFFCLVYGTHLGLGLRASGGQLPVNVLLGVATAAMLFVPTFALAAWIAQWRFARPERRIAALVAAVIGGLACGCLVVDAIPPLAVVRDAPNVRHVATLLPLAAMGLVGLAIFLQQERSEAALRALHEEATRRTTLDREAAEARLLLLQAQVEPHFLFNSLAHVRRLYRKDEGAGRAMLRNLMRYLGAMKPLTNERSIALRAEIELAVAYLGVQQARLGGRLAYEVDVADDALRARVPPMIVTTLVENSVKHGLAVLPEGGAVRIEARVERGSTCIRVSDTGRGFQSTIGSGVGLANARARLLALYGGAASLELSRNEPRGVTARIVVPSA